MSKPVVEMEQVSKIYELGDIKVIDTEPDKGDPEKK